jgi:hypothetical protein
VSVSSFADSQGTSATFIRTEVRRPISEINSMSRVANCWLARLGTRSIGFRGSAKWQQRYFCGATHAFKWLSMLANMKTTNSIRVRASRFVSNRYAYRTQPGYSWELVVFGIIVFTAIWPILLLANAMAAGVR